MEDDLDWLTKWSNTSSSVTISHCKRIQYILIEEINEQRNSGIGQSYEGLEETFFSWRDNHRLIGCQT